MITFYHCFIDREVFGNVSAVLTQILSLFLQQGPDH